jgi:SAM-dependent methyltransferase
MHQKNEWFSSWFDSPYYPKLYKHRDEQEAEQFLQNVLKVIALDDRARVLDLACGKGRHSVALNALGYRVIGLDLSANSISAAKPFENETLRFVRDDMRVFELDFQFQCIFNLFTSFGYFTDEEDNKRVLSRIKKHLLPKGYFVLDYFNSTYVADTLVPSEEMERDGILFRIKRSVEGKQVIKRIDISDGERQLHFEERVQLIPQNTLYRWIEEAGMKVIHTFGSYALEPFDEKKSTRCILIAQN